MQAGDLPAAALHRHRAPLKHIAAAFEGACEGLVGVLVYNDPMDTALDRLAELERCCAALAAAVAGAAGTADMSGKGCGASADQLEQSAALHMVSQWAGGTR